MGDVYKALDTLTQNTVAIKVLRPEVVAEDPTLVERFCREAIALRALNHPNIVRVIDTFDENGRNYIVMEYVPGGSLAELIKRDGQLPIERVVQISLDLADALTRTHRLNIIHRDLKPSNVLLAADGTPRLTDFGVAHTGDGQTMLTQAGSIIGTISYLSPEAAEGRPHDEKSDIWSFGLVIYEMLAGHHPFAEERTPSGMLKAILNEPIPDLLEVRPDTPLELRDLVHGMLAKEPGVRIGSVRTVGGMLEAILNRLQSAKDDAPTPPPSRFANTPQINLPPSLPQTPPPGAPSTPRHVTDPRIFIAYRREDSGDIVERLYTKLAEIFGDNNIVRDVDRIADRTVSRFVLAQDVLGSVDVMLVLIGGQWSGVPGRRTIDSPKDALRVQIEAGLKRPGVLIIPVLLGGASLPKDLPPSLAGLAEKTPFVMGNDIEGQTRKLGNRIKEHFGLKRRLPLMPIAVAVVLALIVLVGGAALVLRPPAPEAATVEPVAAGQFMVLVGDLQPINTTTRDAARFVANDLKQQLENNAPSSPFRVRQYPTVITSADQAQTAATANGASVVVWGSYTDSEVDLHIQSGVTSAFAMQMDRSPVDRLANLSVALTNEQQQSGAQAVLTVFTLLHNAEGDGYELLRTLTILSLVNAQSGTIAGSDAAALNFKALQSYVSNTGQAIDDLNQAIALDGGNPLLYIFRATAYQRQGNFDSALTDIHTAQRLGGDTWTSPYYLLGNDATVHKDYDSAIADYSHIIDARPNDWFPAMYRGALYYLKSDYGQAKTDLDRSISLHPNTNFPFPLATMIALRQGRISDARQLMHTVLTQFPDPSFANRIIQALYGEQNHLIWGPLFSGFTNLVIGQYQSVVSDTQAVLAINDQLADVYLMQGFADCNLHQYPEAEAAYTSGLAIDPHYPLLYALRAEVRRDQGNLVNALSDVTEARKANLSDEFNALIDNPKISCENFWEGSS